MHKDDTKYSNLDGISDKSESDIIYINPKRQMTNMIELNDELIAEIRALSLSELIIKRYPAIQLKLNNSVYIGLCPFHKESKPSFTVFNKNGIESFYCYGCFAGDYKKTQISSDIIGFYMAIEKVDFKTACGQLCAIFGVRHNIIQHDPEVAKLRQKAYKNNELYYKTLAANKDVLKYLINRGLTVESIQYWQLGMVPANDYMVTHKNRLAIPLIDTSNKDNNVCGFAYRSLEGEITQTGVDYYITNDGVKYRNDPNNRIFDKKKLLYGLPQALKAIREINAAIVVEGYFDVMLMHQCKVTNTVGLMGTNFTAEQMDILRKLTNRIFLLMDGDEPGINAALSVIPPLYQNGFEVFVCNPPPGIDAADMCNRFDQDYTAIVKYLSLHMVAGYQYVLQKNLTTYQAKMYLAKTELLQQSLPLLNQLHYINRALYTQYLSEYSGIDPYLINQAALSSLEQPKLLDYTNTKRGVMYAGNTDNPGRGS